jgi:quaternary ammonium compound-resistance protein SugE
MAWIYILIASVFEISWAVGLKYSDGLKNLKSSIFTVVTMILSFVFLAQGSKQLPIGTAYAVWTGIGALGTAAYGILFFNDSREFIRIFFLFLIIAGVVGLKITSK